VAAPALEARAHSGPSYTILLDVTRWRHHPSSSGWKAWGFALDSLVGVRFGPGGQSLPLSLTGRFHNEAGSSGEGWSSASGTCLSLIPPASAADA
jgi:hypothetical protein